MSWFDREPPLGTPQNPEIIQPGERPREARAALSLGRFGILLRLVRVMIQVSLPAAGLDVLSYWLFDVARSPDGYLAWVPLVFVVPPAALFTLLAVLVNLSIAVVFILLLFGRNVRISLPRF